MTDRHLKTLEGMPLVRPGLLFLFSDLDERGRLVCGITDDVGVGLEQPEIVDDILHDLVLGLPLRGHRVGDVPDN